VIFVYYYRWPKIAISHWLEVSPLQQCTHYTVMKQIIWLPLVIKVEFPFNDVDKATEDENYPENVAPTGPILRIRVARDSPSFSGGGCDSFSRFISLQVMRVGAQARPGGTITRMPEWRQPRIAPPRASTTKLTRNLRHTYNEDKQLCKVLTDWRTSNYN